jgi:tRNA(Ile)-lysidine synthase
MEPREKEDRLAANVREYFEKHRVARGSRILVGFSCGPDSTALLHLLWELRGELAISVAAIHVDHGLRPREERSLEAALAASACEGLGIPLAMRSIDEGRIEAEARSSGCGIEAAARKFRRELFDRELETGGFDFLALGHTASDQVETLVMRFFAGSGEAGIKGIPERNGRILRPLMRVFKEEILRYLGERTIPYSTDSTNLESTFLRNRVRNELLPAIRRVFPGYRRALFAVREKSELLDAFARRSLDGKASWRREANALSSEAAAFFALEPALRLRFVFDGADALVPGTRFPYALARLAANATERASGVLFEGAGTRLFVRKGRVFFARTLARERKKGYFFVVEGYGKFGIGSSPSFDVRAPESRVPCGVPVGLPLVLRSRRSDDSIIAGGIEKKVADLLSEWGAGPAERASIPVLEDRGGVFAVLGKCCEHADAYCASRTDREFPSIFTSQSEEPHGF